LDARLMPKFLVLGELNVDLILRGLPSLPILGRELTANEFQLVAGSSSAITAIRLARLGATVDFAGIVGNDDFGRFMLRELEKAGIGTQNVKTVETSTGVTIALSYPKDRALLTYLGTIGEYRGENIIPALLADYSHLHVGAFFLQEKLQAQLPRIFRMAKEAGLTTSLDVGWDPKEQWSDNPYLDAALAECDYFFPNESEAEALGDNLAQKVASLLLVKRGGDGATAYDKTGSVYHAPAMPVEVVDTTGAGDAFNAGFLYAYRHDNRPLPQALAFAVACGSEAVKHVGGATGAPKSELIWRIIDSNE
jgi:sugar/nucleoside kinase (ribokinase family)